ncbi:uncharacterized protein LOC117117939 [Anneissia japonica]|uniref:uncharacterized protein LOC117117939 n=1 Tax=Anneissia japonica TaxID=1529436 RepID=UPI0014258C11|nr:uncharacterized protein LOC117117939 [Anneissia japonica]XP_033118314.1 uncharacterized protein LOC117117939 [Anneissia japonica]
MNQDQSKIGKLMNDNEQLQMALCTLANNIGSSDMCILRLILLDIFNIVKTSALEYFTELQEREEITIKDVSIVYEILLLMGKRKLWTEFRRTLVDGRGNGHDHAYNVEKNSTHFSDFRRTMIKIGKQFTGKLDSLSMMYTVPDDITSIWMTLIYLEDKRKVNSAEETSLLKFKKKLTVAGSPQAGWTIQQYVERNFSSQSHASESRKPINAERMERNSSSQTKTSEQMHSEPESTKPIHAKEKMERNSSSQTKTTEQMHSEPESTKPIHAKGKRRSLEINNLTIEVKKRQQRVEAMEKKIRSSAEECCRMIKETGEQLKNKIDLCVSTQIDDLENMKGNKLKKLDQIGISLKVYSQQIEEMRNALEHQLPSCNSLNLEKVDKSLCEVYPEVHGYFNINNKNISKDSSKFKDNVCKYYVDYKPVDPDKCSVNFHDLNNRCFNINETIRLEVVLKDSQDKPVSEEHESAPVKVCAQLQEDLENLKSNSNYEFSKIPGQKFPTFELKFTNTGLWKLSVFVCGEMVPKPINLKILSDEGLKKIIPLNTKEFRGGPIFDVCFTSNGKYLLACNFTDTIFSFDLNGLRLFSVGEDKKIANLCSIDDGHVFLT